MKREKVENFVKELVHEIWEKYNDEKLSQFYHPDLEGHYNDDVVNYDKLVKKLKIFKEHMPGMKIEITDLIIEDDSFVLHATQRFKKGGSNIEIPTVLIAHLEDGKIKKYWVKTEMPLDFNDN